MSLIETTFDTSGAALEFLESLAVGNRSYIFRGHVKDSYRLQTSYAREFLIPHESWDSRIDEMLDRFRSGLVRIGAPTLDSENRLDWLEYARHHGVPTPCLDFSYSPYVALFFAFTGIDSRAPYRDDLSYSVIYALDVNELAKAWAREFLDSKTKDDNQYYKACQEFLSPKTESLFAKGFPGHMLQFLPAPSRFNV